MPALSYHARFVDYVEGGLKKMSKKRVKRTTIRAFRKRPFKVGDKLSHYYAQRHPTLSRKLGESIAKSCRNVIIYPDVVYVAKADGGFKDWRGKYDEITDKKALDKFAFEDGFDSWDDMVQFWVDQHGDGCLPFYGVQIKW